MMDFDEVRGILEPKSTSLDQKLSEFREDRDSWNSKVKKYLTERNEINRQVKELITEVQNQKVIRDEANSKVKELKIIRAERSTVLKQLRAELQEKKPMETQNKAEKKEKKRNERAIRNDIEKMDKKFNYGHFQGNDPDRPGLLPGEAAQDYLHQRALHLPADLGRAEAVARSGDPREIPRLRPVRVPGDARRADRPRAAPRHLRRDT